MKELMIDIETLSTRPNAHVLSVAAILFDDRGGDLSPFYLRLRGAEQVEVGRHIDHGTVEWWMRQDPAAMAEALGAERYHPKYVLQKLAKVVDRGGLIWANSPSFDLVILESLYRDFDLPLPWSFAQARDVRTLRYEVGLDGFEPAIEGVAHDPIYDCRYQIAVVRECRRRLRT